MILSLKDSVGVQRMFKWFKKKQKLHLSEDILEKIYDETEALLLQLHPEEPCFGPCIHKDAEKDMPLFSELIPRAAIIHGVIDDENTEKLLGELLSQLMKCFCAKNNIKLEVK